MMPDPEGTPRSAGEGGPSGPRAVEGAGRMVDRVDGARRCPSGVIPGGTAVRGAVRPGCKIAGSSGIRIGRIEGAPRQAGWTGSCRIGWVRSGPDPTARFWGLSESGRVVKGIRSWRFPATESVRPPPAGVPGTGGRKVIRVSGATGLPRSGGKIYADRPARNTRCSGCVRCLCHRADVLGCPRCAYRTTSLLRQRGQGCSAFLRICAPF